MDGLFKIRDDIKKALEDINVTTYTIDFIHTDIENTFYIDIRAKIHRGYDNEQP